MERNAGNPIDAPADGFRVRAMHPDEIALAADWAAAEGWNPGLADPACFATVDAEGFLIGELDGAPAATLSVVNYDPRFAFLGFYIVRPELRGRGYGWRTWQAGIAHAGSRTIGLDGVVAQQENYRRSGFALAHRNVRYGGAMSATAPPDTVSLAQVPFPALEADDASVFPAPRAAFLRAWIAAPGHVGRAVVRDGRLCAWGVIRPCRRGFKIGPLVADDAAGAARILAALAAAVGGGELFLDVPEPNAEAVALARAHGLAPVFETARMYTGADPSAAAGTGVRRHDLRTGLTVAAPAVTAGKSGGSISCSRTRTMRRTSRIRKPRSSIRRRRWWRHGRIVSVIARIVRTVAVDGGNDKSRPIAPHPAADVPAPVANACQGHGVGAMAASCGMTAEAENGAAQTAAGAKPAASTAPPAAMRTHDQLAHGHTPPLGLTDSRTLPALQRAPRNGAAATDTEEITAHLADCIAPCCCRSDCGR